MNIKKIQQTILLGMVLIIFLLTLTGCNIDKNYDYTLEDREQPSNIGSADLIVEYGYLNELGSMEDSIENNEDAMYVIIKPSKAPKIDNAIMMSNFCLQSQQGGLSGIILTYAKVIKFLLKWTGCLTIQILY